MTHKEIAKMAGCHECTVTEVSRILFPGRNHRQGKVQEYNESELIELMEALPKKNLSAQDDLAAKLDLSISEVKCIQRQIVGEILPTEKGKSPHFEKEKMMTRKEIAKMAGCDIKTVTETSKRLFPGRTHRKGQVQEYNKSELIQLMEALPKKNMVALNDANLKDKSINTDSDKDFTKLLIKLLEQQLEDRKVLIQMQQQILQILPQQRKITKQKKTKKLQGQSLPSLEKINIRHRVSQLAHKTKFSEQEIYTCLYDNLALSEKMTDYKKEFHEVRHYKKLSVLCWIEANNFLFLLEGILKELEDKYIQQ